MPNNKFRHGFMFNYEKMNILSKDVKENALKSERRALQ